MRDKFILAHKMTKELKAKYSNIDYRAQFGICLKYVMKKQETKNRNSRIDEFKRLARIGFENIKRDKMDIDTDRLFELVFKKVYKSLITIWDTTTHSGIYTGYLIYHLTNDKNNRALEKCFEAFQELLKEYNSSDYLLNFKPLALMDMPKIREKIS